MSRNQVEQNENTINELWTQILPQGCHVQKDLLAEVHNFLEQNHPNFLATLQ